ncbi:MAG: NosD domain-containing protein [Candidatus Bathyarchaeia archaeon]
MNKAIALVLIVALLVVSAFACSQLAPFVSANFFPDPDPDLPRIYIRSDGSVEPATAPIEKRGNVYRLTADIVLYTVEIQRDNIALDGAGYAIQGNASRWKGFDDGNNGVIVVGRRNVNITHVNFELSDTGVRVLKSSNVNIINNSFGNGLYRGILLQDCMEILVEGNRFEDIQSDFYAVSCGGSKVTIRNNSITGSTRGVRIEGSSNLVADNRIEAFLPVILDEAYANTIAGNTITGPATQNYKGGEGIALFRNCSCNTISGNNITGFGGQAIRTVFDCSNNIFFGNYLANNEFAITLQRGAENNTFYGNTFTADSCKIRVDDGVHGTLWDNGTMGNYWGNYNGTDNNMDRIGDIPYIIIG